MKLKKSFLTIITSLIIGIEAFSYPIYAAESSNTADTSAEAKKYYENRDDAKDINSTDFDYPNYLKKYGLEGQYGVSGEGSVLGDNTTITDEGDYSGSFSETTGIGYADWMIDIANNHDEVGYSQTTRCLNPNVDCASFVYYALIFGGYPELKRMCPYPFCTSSMGTWLSKLGFSKVSNGSLQPGDILLNPSKHVQVYVGKTSDGVAHDVAAHSNYDGKNGDSSGREVSVSGHWTGFTEVWRNTNAVSTSYVNEQSDDAANNQVNDGTYVASAKTDIENSEEYKKVQAQCTWTGTSLTQGMGVVNGPNGRETYYHMNMAYAVELGRKTSPLMKNNTDPMWTRSDGVQMLGNYVMVAMNTNKYPKGTIVETSLGMGIVVDHCEAAESTPTIDISVTWGPKA